MKAVLLKAFGSSDQLFIGETEKPYCGQNEILIKVKATALNRADTLQRKGAYPPPPGASDILGLEVSGIVEDVGTLVDKWKIGDRVMALLAGGGYAEYINVNENCVMPIPNNLSFEEAAAIPEVFLTAYQALHFLANIEKGETVLIHAGASGVGTAAIQLAKLMEAQIIVTASAQKHEICKSLGANFTIDYKTQNFENIVKEITHNKGSDIIIDFLAASYLQKNINSLGFDGRMVILALMGGISAEINMGKILMKRLKIMGSTLRARSITYKSKLINSFSKNYLKYFESKKLVPVIDSVYDWNEVVKAHDYMEANLNKGKIILKV